MEGVDYKNPSIPLGTNISRFLEGEGTIFRSRIYIIIDDSDFSNEKNRCDASEPALIIICQNPYSCEKILFFSRKEKKTIANSSHHHCTATVHQLLLCRTRISRHITHA